MGATSKSNETSGVVNLHLRQCSLGGHRIRGHERARIEILRSNELLSCEILDIAIDMISTIETTFPSRERVL